MGCSLIQIEPWSSIGSTVYLIVRVIFDCKFQNRKRCISFCTSFACLDGTCTVSGHFFNPQVWTGFYFLVNSLSSRLIFPLWWKLIVQWWISIDAVARDLHDVPCSRELSPGMSMKIEPGGSWKVYRICPSWPGRKSASDIAMAAILISCSWNR